MALKQNSAEGGANGLTVTNTNSGGASGTGFNTVTTTGSPTRVYSSAQKAHGTLSYQVAAAASSTVDFGFASFTATSSLALRFYLYHTTSPTNGQEIFQVYSGGGAAKVAVVALSGTGRIQVMGAAATLSTFPTPLVVGTWYRIEMQLTVGASTTTGSIACQYYVHDQTTPVDPAYSSSTANLGTNPATTIHFGKLTPAATLDSFFDDIAYDDGATAPIGVPNPTPIASAGSNQTNTQPYAVVTLSGTDSDSDGIVVSRQWRQVSGSPSVAITNATSANASYTAPGTIAGTSLVFGYTVTDNDGLESVEAETTHTILPATKRAIVGGIEVPIRLMAAQGGGLV